jgi:hypothetical protein
MIEKHQQQKRGMKSLYLAGWEPASKMVEKGRRLRLNKFWFR